MNDLYFLYSLSLQSRTNKEVRISMKISRHFSIHVLVKMFPYLHL